MENIIFFLEYIFIVLIIFIYEYEKLKIKDPVRTSEIPLTGATYSLRTTRVDAIEPWYGQNRFLLTAYKIRPGTTQRIGLIVNKMEYW